MAKHETTDVEPGGEPMPESPRDEHRLAQFQRRMGVLFDDFFGDWDGWRLPTLSDRPRWLGGFSPRTDIRDDGTQFTVTVEVPGIEEKDIRVSLTDNLLTIEGEKREESEQEGRDFVRRERAYGGFQRTLRLPSDVEADQVKAAFRNGVLTVTAPKAAESRERTRQIPVEN